MPEQNLIDVMLNGGMSKRDVERRLAEMSLGVVDALREGILTPEQAYGDLFNLDVYESIIQHRLDSDLRALFECGMQLEDVAEIVPVNLERNYEKIERLARKVVTKGFDTRNSGKTRSKPRPIPLPKLSGVAGQ